MLCPLDGRYKGDVKELGDEFSEERLIVEKLHIEGRWLLHNLDLVDGLEEYMRQRIKEVIEVEICGAEGEAEEALIERARAIEREVRHDTKAIEFVVREVLKKHLGEAFGEKESEKESVFFKVLNLVHFGLTSEDVTGLAYTMLIIKSYERAVLPAVAKVWAALDELRVNTAESPLLSQTHGQAASPTTVGKEVAVFQARLRRQLFGGAFKEVVGQIPVKFGGAVNTFGAMMVAYPEVDWAHDRCRRFIETYICRATEESEGPGPEGLGPEGSGPEGSGPEGSGPEGSGPEGSGNSLGLLRLDLFGTQINDRGWMCSLLHSLMRQGAILLDLCRDFWLYISRGVFGLKVVKGEVGSSTMPHKINPIQFENAEGNLEVFLGLANSLGLKLMISRLQRDLSDSTVIRNFGMCLGYYLLACKSIHRGLIRLQVDQQFSLNEIQTHSEVIAEPIQSVLRRLGTSEDPYTQIKLITRHKSTENSTQNSTQSSTEDLVKIIDELHSRDELSRKLASNLKHLLTNPQDYTGLAPHIATLTPK